MTNSPPSSGDIADFYDVFSDKLLTDYVQGNKRFDHALRFVLGSISKRTNSVLDIGCGAGVSAKEIKKYHPDVEVAAIDISPRNISIAQALFGDAGVQYEVSNLTDGVFSRRFDLLTMIDVHEHVPRSEWPNFHAALAERMSEHGTLVMTFPSVQFQAYLHTYDPNALQVVDESITLQDIVALATRVGGEIKVYRHVNVYREGDYVYVVISRCKGFDGVPFEPLNLKTIFPKVRKRLRRYHRGYFAKGRLASLQNQKTVSDDLATEEGR